VIETGSGLDKVFVVFDGRQFVLPVTAHSWLSSLRLAPGKHTWKIFAYDRAGNSSSWSGWLQIPRR
jgi:hypothetical protein